MKKRRTINIINLTIIMLFGLYELSGATIYNYTTIAYPGALRTQIYGINDFGQMVGEYYYGGVTHGFMYDDGNFTTIDYPGCSNTPLSGINNIGQIVGRCWNSGFIYDNDSFTTLSLQAARGINDYGQIVGRRQIGNGFLYDNGNYIPIQGTNPRDINNNGQIVGDNGLNGFLEYGSTLTAIEYPGGVLRTDATGINDAGIIVGFYSTHDSDIRHGYLYDGNTYSIIDYPDATDTFLQDINNSGQIVGDVNIYGQTVGFLMTPTVVPEPISSMLFLTGGGVLAGRRYFRKIK